MASWVQSALNELRNSLACGIVAGMQCSYTHKHDEHYMPATRVRFLTPQNPPNPEKDTLLHFFRVWGGLGSEESFKRTFAKCVHGCSDWLREKSKRQNAVEGQKAKLMLWCVWSGNRLGGLYLDSLMRAIG
eukprot:4063334-Amphidinium_carterae.1